MHVLRIEHTVADYDAWKRAFDGDPLGREQGGVRRYRVLRAADDPNDVMIDLEFETASEAESFHAKLRDLWSRVDLWLGHPEVRTAELIESKQVNSPSEAA